MTDTSMRAKLTFPEDLVSQPVIARLALDHAGWIVCELTGTREALDSGVEWLTSTGIKVDWLGGPVES